MIPLEIIKEKVIAANPSIMDLKFGCEVKVFETSECIEMVGKLAAYEEFPSPKDIEGAPYHDDHTILTIVVGENAFTFKDVWEGTNFSIIGRPIRLTDILYAITAKEIPMTYYMEKVDKILLYYDTLHDDITLQTEDTQKLIAELLQ